MKKVISLIAAVAMLFALSTSAFAALSMTPTVTVGSIEGTTITAGDDGFEFKIIATEKVKMSTMTVDISGLLNDGWTISPIDGAYGFDPSGYGYDSYTGTQLQPKANMNAAGHDCVGKSLVQFKATPSASSTFTNLTFKVSPTVVDMSNGQYKTPVVYTVVKAAVQEDETTATIGANGEVTFDYADADAADAKLADKKVVLGTAYAGNLITADTTVKVTYTPVEGAAETKTFGETLFEKLGVEGFGFLETESITFGIVCDKTMTGTFSFALN